MLAQQAPYQSFGLVQDMMTTPEVIRRFDSAVVEEIAGSIRAAGRLLFTGEGSSRLFPAGAAIRLSRQQGWPLELHTEAGLQAAEYNLKEWAVLALSNSGRTAEVIRLYHALEAQGHPAHYSLTALAGSTLESLATRGFVLGCGKEGAVAATKSVIEQALFCRALVEAVAQQRTLQTRLESLAVATGQALTMPIERGLIERIAGAGTIYFAGRHDGVAAELALKTNEITRKRSGYLEGTYAVHGIEEVMQADDVVIWLDPLPQSEDKFFDVLVKGVGLTVIAIANRPTRFPTVQIADAGDLSGFVQLCAGWNLLVETGLMCGVDLDKPQRARKVGNEFTG